MEVQTKTVKRTTAKDYQDRLDFLIQYRNKKVSKKHYRSDKNFVFDKDNYPCIDDFKLAISETKGIVPDMATFFKVPRHVIVHWLKSNENFKDAFISYVISCQSNSLFITVEEMTSSVEWKMCVFETEMSPLDIKGNYLLTRNMAPIFKFKSFLYAFPFFKKYGNVKDVRFVREKIFTLYHQAKTSVQIREVILGFEKISGLSFQNDIVK